MRELIGRAMSASDLSHQDFECHVDRLGALARGNALGSAMLWAMLSGEQHWLFSLADKLAERLRGHTLRSDDCRPIAALCIMERTMPHCRSCGGAKVGRDANGVMIDCPSCQGLGMHRFTDGQRSQFLGRAWGRRDARLLGIAAQKLSAAELAALAEIRYQLERA